MTKLIRGVSVFDHHGIMVIQYRISQLI